MTTGDKVYLQLQIPRRMPKVYLGIYVDLIADFIPHREWFKYEFSYGIFST